MQTEDTLHQIAYFSRPTCSMSLIEVRELLIKAQINNHFNDVTGMLLFDGDSFLQIIEGPEDTLKALVQKIERDPRHTQFITLMDRKIPERDFGGWSMGLAHIEGQHMRSLPGLVDIQDTRVMLSKSETAESLVAMIKSRYGKGDIEADVA
jgi:hypothetical protein